MVLGPRLMGAAALGVGLLARNGGWPAALTAPLLLAAGAGHACAFSPLASRMTSVVAAGQAADLSGLVMTSSLVGQVLGIACFAGMYLGAAPRGSVHAFALTTGALAAALMITSVCARVAVSRPASGLACAASTTR